MSYKPENNLKVASDFNIKPNSGVDETANFVRAFASASALFLPEGNYIVGDLVLNGKNLFGQGTLIKEANAQDTLIVQGDGTKIKGIYFRSTSTGVRRSEIKLDDGCKNVTISDCDFEGSIYGCITADTNGVNDKALTFVNRASNIQIANNIFKGYVRPLYLHSVEDVLINANSFRDTLRDAIRIRQDSGFLSITNNMFKDIGEFSPSIVERPANWISTGGVYEVGDQVSVPPFGIYECNTAHTSTTLLNPATGGSSLWDPVSIAYFETMDAIDTFWSGKEMIIANNMIDTTASVGIDIKGSEPSGDYSTTSVIVANNEIKNTFGIGLNFHSASTIIDDRGDIVIPARTINLSGGNIESTAQFKYIDIFFKAVNQGTAGNSISLVFNGTDDIDTVVDAWNLANVGNEVEAKGAKADEHYYIGNSIITGNIFDGCNAERYDVSQPAINLRQGSSNVTISDNIVRNHFGRGLNITNLEYQTKIQRSILLTGNQIIDCGLPGHPGNVGLNLSPVDGLIIKNSIIENTKFRKPHKFVLEGTVPATGTLEIPSVVDRSSISVDLATTANIGDVLTALQSDINGKVFPDDPSLTTIRYYEEADIKVGGFANVIFGTNDEVTVTALTSGTIGNGLSVEVISGVEYNTALDSPAKGIIDVDGNVIKIYVRTSASITNLLGIWASSKNFDRLNYIGEIPLQGGGTSFQYIRSNVAGVGTEVTLTGDGTSSLQDLLDASGENIGVVYGNSAIVPLSGTSIAITNVEAVAGALADLIQTAGSTPVTLATGVSALSGGIDSDEIEFHSRIASPFRNVTFPIVVGSLTLHYVEEKNYTNSVNKVGIFLRETEGVGTAPLDASFSAGIGKTIIKDNIVRNNNASPRFEIQYNGQEIKAPTAYVTSNNAGNSTTVNTLARTNFTNGADSDAGNHSNTLANLSVQGIILQARKAGVEGNLITLTINTALAANGILRVVSAPITSISGYEIGGKEIIVFLPSDGSNDGIDVTVEELENLLKIHLNQSILKIEDNILE